MQDHSAQPLLAPDDCRERFVRFQRLTEQGFVEFAFGMGSGAPDLMVDLILPLEAYKAFCLANRVRYLSREQEHAADLERDKWRGAAVGTHE